MRRSFEYAGAFGSRTFMATLCGLWLWVYLSPMQQLGLVSNAASFVPGFILVVVAQILPWFSLRVIVALFTVAYYGVRYFTDVHLTLLQRTREFVDAEWASGRHFVATQQLSDPLQTSLFILAMIAMYWLLNYASSHPRMWFFYNLLGILVLTVVDGNTPVHPNVAMVVVLATGILVMVNAHYRNLRPSANGGRIFAFRFFAPASVLLGVGLTLAWLLPKQPAVWASPATWLNGFGGGLGGGAKQVIGYESDPGHLGGSFVMSTTPVFVVKTTAPNYLRGQSYSLYTGKGWAEGSQAKINQTVNRSFGAQSANNFWNIPADKVEQTIQVVSHQLDVNVVFGGYEMTGVYTHSPTVDRGLELNTGSDTVFGKIVQGGQTYSVQSLEMTMPYDLLQSTKENLNIRTLPSSVVADDLQLPSELPTRVSDLAKQIVTSYDAKSEYDKVVAVQNYLDQNYSYQISDIPVPVWRQDYVDQFLFQSKKGYCNNFSTSMAVLLRTLQIPTRWVTGFATGSQNLQYQGPNAELVVTNADAHSWVEVYFPKFGWIPFDPTPGFTIPFSIAQTAGASGDSQSSQVTPTKPHKHPQPARQTASTPTPTGGQSVGAGRSWLRMLLWILSVVLVALVIVMVVFRRKLILWRYTVRWRKASSDSIDRPLAHLIRTLSRKGDLAKGAITLRDLAPAARSYGIERKDYEHLVRIGEQAWYGNEQIAVEDAERVKVTTRTWLERILFRPR